MNVDDKRPQRRSGTSLAVPVVVVLLAAGAVVLFLVMRENGRPEPAPTTGGNVPKAAAPAAPSGNVPGSQTEPAHKDPVAENDGDTKPKAGPVEVADLLKLADGDVRDQYKAFGGLRRIAKDGLRPDLAKQIVDHARQLIESGDKGRTQTGIRLIEISGDCQQGQFLLETWEKSLQDKDIETLTMAALGNLLQGRRNVTIAKEHPEWSKDVVQKQAMRSATTSCMSCGADPAKWRELWKSLMAETEAKSAQKPEAKAEEKPPAAPQP